MERARLIVASKAVFWMAIPMLSSVASAAVFSGTGTINSLISSDSTWGADADYFVVNGVTSLGTCPTQGGMVVFILKDDAKAQRQFAMVLSARSTEAAVTVVVDDTYVSSQGYCYLRHISY